MKKLIIVADDFGITPGVNQGCLGAMQKGILGEMSLMVGFPGTKPGVSIVKSAGLDKRVGLHVSLCDYERTGKYLRSADYAVKFAQDKPEVIQKQVRDELKEFEDLLGHAPSHINGHQNCHLHPVLIEVVSEYALGHNIFVRRNKNFSNGSAVAGDNASTQYLLDHKVKTTDYMFEYVVGSYEEAKAGFINDLKTVKDGETVEFVMHPAHVDELLRQFSSLTDDRERDLKLLLDKDFKEKIESLGFVITNFS